MFSPYYYHSHGIKVALKWYNAIWWKLMPGVTVKVIWPNGPVVKDFIDQYKSDNELLSTDPNDHYRPWMESNVGRQGWDWDWCMKDNDLRDNTLTIKFRKGKESYATMAMLRWS
jgi:hypothetical protein